MSLYVQTNQCVTLTDANNTISAADTGKIFLIPPVVPAATTRTITLPTTQLCLRYKFIMLGLVGALNTSIVTITGGATSMRGQLTYSGASLLSGVAGANSFSFQGGAAGVGAGPGDTIEVTCMQVLPAQWSCNGSASATAPFA